ncbi:MAG: PIN domain-containing protein [Myxococcales bacterium]|nr:PIN domain-containing protein [Myxococcales bacterium]
MSTRYVFDTGALIGAERGDKRPLDYLALVQRGQAEIVTPIVCIIEWWRGRTDRCEKLLRAIVVEPLPLSVAQAAGMALAKMKQRVDSKLTIDAAVMAFAALLDAPVITSDVGDLERLRALFPGVRVLSV